MTQDRRGKIVVLEGLDGCGKGAQLEKLKLKFPEALFTREPGGTSFADEMRALILAGMKTLSCRTEFFNFFAARSDLWEKAVVPAVTAGRTVICDRADASTFAFQLYGQNGNDALKKFFWPTRQLVFGDYEPDLYIILDASPEECQRRLHLAAQAQAREISDFDTREIAFHIAVREGYLEFERQQKERVVRVNGQRAIEEVHSEIWAALTERNLVPA